MKPEKQSRTLLGITRSQAKMIEFAVPDEHRLSTTRRPADLLPLTVGILGDLAAGLARPGTDRNLISSVREELRFAAYFFDAYLNGTPDSPARGHLILLAAAAYYLCDLPGSSFVLAQRWQAQADDLEEASLAISLAWFLRGGAGELRFGRGLGYAEHLNAAGAAFVAFYRQGIDQEALLAPLRVVRTRAYAVGSARELLLADLIHAVVRRRLEISSRFLLPQYTGLGSEVWEPALSKPTFMRELWPAQRLLGEQGVFSGGSAVVQMPTSAGKTRATEILIRSAFLSGRAKVVVVVAPFRALCHEIRASLLMALRGEEFRVDEISDVPQPDFDWAAAAEKPRVIVVTPEKLLYLLRQQPELAQLIGLLVYDEGHQFDSGYRGVTYELLLASLKKLVPATCQVVLVSAVISNAAAINEWLNGEHGRVVAGTDLLPTLRSVAFASWIDKLGELHFSAQADSGRHRFYVPRVLESFTLTRFKGEKKARYFPERTDGQSIALFLGLKLVAQGSVAVFCGIKSSVRTACESLADAYKRGLALPPPREVSNQEEVAKLARLVRRHLGEDGPLPRCADLGVFTHHASTPTGIRLAVEHAMKDSSIKMVICTSTLAQGVNLPLRYLLVTGIYQGRQRIKVRDFQNLIGRTGRSGMHTEGSVIFADPSTYDQRERTDLGEWQWRQVAELLDPMNSEECASHLLTLFNPIYNERQTDSEEFSVTSFLRLYLKEDGGLPAVLASWTKKLRGRDFRPEVVDAQLRERAKVVDALQSFLMAASSEDLVSLDAAAAAELARETLAYHLAKPEHQAELELMFQTLAADVVKTIPSATVRKAYAKNLFGIRDSIAIHVWVTEQTATLEATETDRDLLLALWPILLRGIANSTFLKCSRPDLLPEFACRWLDGHTSAELLQFLKDQKVRIGLGQNPRHPDFDHVVEMCENALGYEGVLVLAAVIEALRMNGRGDDPLSERLLHLQKRLKYGLASATAITLHELGFADRVLASDLARILEVETRRKSRVRKLLRLRRDEVEDLLGSFPSYFSFVWEVVLHGRRST